MKYIVIVFFGTFLISCNGQKKVTRNNGEFKKELSLVIKDNYSGITTPEIQIIKEPKTLKSFFLQINKTRKPRLAVPKIDFTKEMIIILCRGEQQKGIISKLVLQKEQETKLFIKVKEEISKEKSTAITTPFYLYKMPLADKEIVFEKEE